MQISLDILSGLLILFTLLDGFETILLPRRITHRFRFSRFYYRSLWEIWQLIARFLRGKWREAFLSIFGPFSMLGLFVSWILLMIIAFALSQWSLESATSTGGAVHDFLMYLYFSGTTFVTLGLGDVTPTTGISRFLTAFEGAIGFGFLAIIISYLPVLYQAFSRREVTISLMDARAGSPPSSGQFILRLARGKRLGAVDPILREWEQWCAELLESHISFPVLAYYRSQHANQSWLATLATMLDSCAMLLTTLRPDDSYQAQLTFAMARHAAVDIALIFSVAPRQIDRERLQQECKAAHNSLLRSENINVTDSPEAEARLAQLRSMYEPFLLGLADHFMLTIPPMLAEETADNWQRSAWMPRPPKIGDLPVTIVDGDHFD